MSDYPSFGKIPRLYKSVVVTEKIDGVNGLILIQPAEDWAKLPNHLPLSLVDGLHIFAGSRAQWLHLNDDPHGFARWVRDHATELVRGLGPGRHYGEWWGAGIGRGYGLTSGEKRFSLFNVTRWGDSHKRPTCCGVVPVVATGSGKDLSALVETALLDLSYYGSHAAPGYDRPEGVVLFHTAANALLKVTLEGDSKQAGSRASSVPIPYVGRHVSDVPPWTWPATRMAPFSLALVG